MIKRLHRRVIAAQAAGNMQKPPSQSSQMKPAIEQAGGWLETTVMHLAGTAGGSG